MLQHEVEKKTGIPGHCIRYYREQELIHPRQDENGYYIYDEKDINDIVEIKELLELGLSVDLIKKIRSGEITKKDALEMVLEKYDSIIKDREKVMKVIKELDFAELHDSEPIDSEPVENQKILLNRSFFRGANSSKYCIGVEYKGVQKNYHFWFQEICDMETEAEHNEPDIFCTVSLFFEVFLLILEQLKNNSEAETYCLQYVSPYLMLMRLKKTSHPLPKDFDEAVDYIERIIEYIAFHTKCIALPKESAFPVISGGVIYIKKYQYTNWKGEKDYHYLYLGMNDYLMDDMEVDALQRILHSGERVENGLSVARVALDENSDEIWTEYLKSKINAAVKYGFWYTIPDEIRRKRDQGIEERTTHTSDQTESEHAAQVKPYKICWILWADLFKVAGVNVTADKEKKEFSRKVRKYIRENFSDVSSKATTVSVTNYYAYNSLAEVLEIRLKNHLRHWK